ncbi:MAG: hypothetical protein M0R73_11855 [Dehalococcoidia bacterium]|nr:hypothetical protein [Dehalococcoidia bacterium]
MKIPEDLRYPSGGEGVDELATGMVKLAHEAIDRFPDVKRRHMFLAGGAAISSALVVAAGVAVMRRVRAGQTPADAVRDVTEDEIEGLRLVERKFYRPNGDNGTADADAASTGVTAETPAADASDTTGQDVPDVAGS